MNAAEAAHAYRLGLMGPKTRAEYEDAVRMGVVNDNYAMARVATAAHPASGVLSGAMATLNRAIPFSSEAGAGLEAGLQTLGDMATGKKADPVARYQALRAAQQGDIDQTRAAHPVVSNLATGTGYAAQLLAALASGGASAEPEVAAATTQAGKVPLKAAASRLAVTGLKNATTGAGFAALNGAAQPGDLSTRVRTADAAIPAGAAYGAAIPVIAAAGKGLASAVPFVGKRAGAVASEIADAASRAVSGQTPYDQAAPIPAEAVARGKLAALDYLKQLGATPESLRQAVLDAQGKPLTTAEAVGPGGITQATGIARRAGTTPAIADATLVARKDSRAQRVIADIADATGLDPSAARGHIEALLEQGQKMAKPLFDNVRAIQGPVMTPELAQWAQTPVGKRAIAATVDDIRNVPGGNPLEHGLPVDPDTGGVGASTPGLDKMELQPTAAAWDMIRKRMGSMVERDAFGKIVPDSQSPGNYNINASKAFLTKALAGDGSNPGLLTGYRDALDQAGDYLGIKSAFDNATGKLFGKSAAADPTDFAKWHAGLKPIEQEAAKASAANDIMTGLQNGTLRPGTFALPHVQMKLTTLFGPDATAKLTDSMDAEARMSAAEARMRPNLNSVTGDVIGSGADQTDANADAGLRAAGHLIMGKPGKAGGALAKGLAPYLSAAQKPFDMATRNALGDLLYADPAVVAHLLEARNAASVPMGQPAVPTLSIPARALAIQAGADQDQR